MQKQIIDARCSIFGKISDNLAGFKLWDTFQSQTNCVI